MPTKIKVGGCQLGDCKRRKGDYCCAECGYKGCKGAHCKNPCLNDPSVCGQVDINEGERLCQNASNSK